jgi:hypothetical protein
MLSLKSIFISSILVIFSSIPMTLNTGCGQSCTMIGCNSQITVKLQSQSSSTITSFSGNLSIDNQNINFECNGTETYGTGFHCTENNEIIFNELSEKPMNNQYTLDIQTSTEEYSKILQPVFKDVFPNGKDCDVNPVCYQAEIAVTLE